MHPIEFMSELFFWDEIASTNIYFVVSMPNKL